MVILFLNNYFCGNYSKTAYHTNPMLAENRITLASLYKILFEEEPLTLSDQCMQKLEESFDFLKRSPTTR